MDIPTSGDIIGKIEAFLDRHAMAPSRFGREATGDQNLVADLKAGRSPKLDRLHRISAYMAAKDAERDGMVDHAVPDTAAAAPASPGNARDLTPPAEQAA